MPLLKEEAYTIDDIYCLLYTSLFAYVAMGATWFSTILPSAGIGMQNNLLYQLANFNYLHIGGMSFWTPYGFRQELNNCASVSYTHLAERSG